ncbi:hypothetical protein CHUAL_011835 [Chamberlinius hualienensis]
MFKKSLSDTYVVLLCKRDRMEVVVSPLTSGAARVIIMWLNRKRERERRGMADDPDQLAALAVNFNTTITTVGVVGWEEKMSIEEQKREKWGKHFLILAQTPTV